ncbi:MAG: IreB family regulatory phosphoprotein [Mycoplasmatales bacterium]
MNSGTIKIDTKDIADVDVKEILKQVHDALEDKGYNAKEQIAGYLISGDPSYIPRYANARLLIKQVQREDIINELLNGYLNAK